VKTKSVTGTKTHFEQVPVSAIKKLLEKDQSASGKVSLTADNLTVERPANKTEPYSVRKP
jgi:hypothetical protein